MNQQIKTSILVYVLFILTLGYHIFSGSFSGYVLFFVLGALLIMIKDILSYGYTPKDISYQSLDYKKIFQNLGDSLSLSEVFFIINRTFIFPAFLVLYLGVLLIQQTGIFGIELPKIFSGSLLLSITIISGICTVFKEQLDDSYKIQKKSPLKTQFHIILSTGLCLLGAYIIGLQTQNLGILSYAISFLGGCIIFLVGLSLLDEEETLPATPLI